MANKNVSVNLFGCLPLILACLLLGALGFCGTDCQQDIQGGIRSTVNAFQGK